AALGTTSLVTLAPGATAAGTTTERFVVLYKDGANLTQARKAVAAAGGKIIKENLAARVAVVETRSASFRIAAGRQSTLGGVARDRYIGYAPPAAPVASATPTASTAARTSQLKGSGTAEQQRQSGRDLERERVAGASTTVQRSTASTGTVGTEPLAARQWDMQLIHATEAQRQQSGDKRVLVGVIDTGVDGTHPDIAPNFNKALSRNFVRDIPVDPAGNELDGPCEFAGCLDPADHDDDGHGTHVASTIASPVNGTGIAGVAPDVSIVNVRAGQDSGYFFLMPTLDALTYSGDAGLDVVNMSFYTDPWLFNCRANPADSPAEQEEQRVIITATQRAVDYAYARGTTLIAAAGNENTDLSQPSVDETSPDYPQATKTQEFAHPRTIDPKQCVSVPTQSNHVIAVAAAGPSTRLSYYSNYGTGQIDVAAPGGDTRDVLGRPQGAVLAAVPLNVLKANDELDANGDPKGASVGFVVRDPKDPNAYYQYLQGTSMAAPHAVGVAALIVSQYGTAGPGGSFGLAPSTVQGILQGTATEHDCPTPAKVVYAGSGGYESTCEGGLKYNGFYGHGIVDAQSAVNAG
ncbi:MAG: peptidase and in kexin sedolisin, partial [Frankiales bacterium]|nr:peptidase and in kexin sedolisin [Frankiales bacterium]